MNVLLKLFFPLSKKIIFSSPILANNNLPLKIYCENIVIAFLNFNFLFFILFFPSFFSSIFLSSFFLLHTRTLTLFFFSFFPLFSLPLPPHSRTFHRALFLPLSFFYYLFSFFLSPFSLATSSTSFFPSIPSKHTNLKVTQNHTI